MCVFPLAGYTTLARRDFMRVPKPAARMTTVTRVSMFPIIQCAMRLPRPLPPLAAFHGELDRDGGDGIGIVANQIGLLHIIAADYIDAKFAYLFVIDFHWSRFLARVTAEQGRADLARIQHRVIQ